MEKKILLAAIKTHVEILFTAHAQPYLLYHNFDHTQQAVEYAEVIAAHYSLKEDLLLILLAAAWFHDTGHLLSDIEKHEEKGVWIMRAFLSSRLVDERTRVEIGRCIMATKIPVQPFTLIEQILCDADTYHLGTPDFRTRDAAVWKEKELRQGKKFDNKMQHSLAFLQAHTFYTDYCRQLLAEGKAANIAQLEADIQGEQE
jgi:HD superfamily phosphodiesterase